VELTRHDDAAVMVGRLLAACAHPYVAWRVLPPSARVLLVSAYVAAGYIGVLGGLLVFSAAH
jgi:hypothetical protein